MGNYQRLLSEEHGASLAAVSPKPSVSEQARLATDIFTDLAEVGDSLNRGDFDPMDAYKEIVDIFRSHEPKLDDEGKLSLQALAFGYAKDSGLDFQEALEVWQLTDYSAGGEA